MSDKHTPGPWAHINPDGLTVRHPQVYSDTGPICNATWLGDGRIDELRANSRLIAASPEMLVALQEIVAAADGSGWTQLDATLANARAAITKATGGAA
jgi:hypothetical protein